jgi:Domain of unknown function (DUF4129)
MARASALIGGGLLITLAATLAGLPPPTDVPGASLTVRVPALLQLVVLVLVALSGLLLLFLQRRPRRAGDVPFPLHARRRPSAWSALLALLPFVVLVGVAWYIAAYRRPGEGVHPIERALDVIAGLADLLALAQKPPTRLSFFDATIGALLLTVALGLFAMMLLITFAEPLEQWWKQRGAGMASRVMPEPAVRVGDPRLEPDPRAAIVRAWAAFEQALLAVRAPRAPWQTPAELARATLARLPLPRPAVERLAALFELARFSQRPLGSDARAAACDALDEITRALDEGTARAR